MKTALMKKLHPQLSRPPYRGAGRLYLSVSGGLDSMVMLDLFANMKPVHRADLVGVHVHHHSGDFADRAAVLVRDYCRKLNIPFLCRDFNWNGRGNFEFEASAFRKKTIEAMCGAKDFRVLGHHQGDQAETLFQTLVRGAGVATPLGMTEQNGKTLRPFLKVGRQLLADHAVRSGTPHLLDPSNHQPHHFRNRIRHTVFPVLREFHQGFEARVGGWLDEHQSLRKALAQEAAKLFQTHYHHPTLNRSIFAESPAYLWDFLLRCLWERWGIPKPKRREAEQVIAWLKDQKTGAFDHAGSRVFCDEDALAAFPKTPSKPQTIQLGQPMAWGPFEWILSLEDSKDPVEDGKLIFTPGTGLTKPVREWMRQVEMPLRLRQSLPFIQYENNMVHLCAILARGKRLGLNLTQNRGPKLLPYIKRGTFPISSFERGWKW